MDHLVAALHDLQLDLFVWCVPNEAQAIQQLNYVLIGSHEINSLRYYGSAKSYD